MWDALTRALAAGLSIWDHKEKTKYIDQLAKLQKDYYAEYNKTLSDRNDAILDGLEFQLRILSNSFAASVGKSDAANK